MLLFSLLSVEKQSSPKENHHFFAILFLYQLYLRWLYHSDKRASQYVNFAQKNKKPDLDASHSGPAFFYQGYAGYLSFTKILIPKVDDCVQPLNLSSLLNSINLTKKGDRSLSPLKYRISRFYFTSSAGPPGGIIAPQKYG